MVRSLVFSLPHGVVESLAGGNEHTPTTPEFIITELGEVIITESTLEFMLTES